MSLDDRDSIYLDTISFQSGSTNYNRKSINLSRQTIYHSTEDLPNAPVNINGHNNEYFINSQRYYSDNGLNHDDIANGIDGETPLRRNHRQDHKDEVSTLLLHSNSNTNTLNKQKKEIVTYKQWKSRVKPI